MPFFIPAAFQRKITTLLEKMHNSGQGCKATHGDRILRERARRKTGVNWLLWIFLRWRLRGEKTCIYTHYHFDTSVSPRSKGDGGVMCDTNEKEPY